MINDDSSLNLTGPLAWLYFTLFLWARQTEAKLQTTSWCKVETKSTDRLLRSRKQQRQDKHGDRLIVYIQSSQHCSKNWLRKHKINKPKQLQIFVHLVSANFSIKSQNQGKNAPLRRAS